MVTDFFYANLPHLKNFIEITALSNFQPIPQDWYIIITDVVNSTKEVESGRYKDVNFLGAASIAAVLNIDKKLEIPFVFGGDGASLLIPPSLYAATQQALVWVRELAQEEFGLALRVGAVPVEVVTAAGYDFKIAKLEISPNYYQAIFLGGGLTYATELIKDPATSILYQYPSQDTVEANLDQFECRWQDIPSKLGETVSLIVKTTVGDLEYSQQIYRELIEQITLIYGGESYHHPVTKENLNLTFRYKNLLSEVRARTKGKGKLNKLLCFLKLVLINFIGVLIMKYKLKLPDIDGGIYKDILISTTDYRKFDDMLRMVIAGNAAQRKKLREYLEKNFREGKLVYGLHRSDRALMTCLVFERSGYQVHFVDGADGGYTEAARDMKRRTKQYPQICA